MRRVASMPLSPGMLMSMTTTSGTRERAASTASSPVAASPTTSVSAIDSSSARRPPRKSGWSSAIRIRIGGLMEQRPPLQAAAGTPPRASRRRLWSRSRRCRRSLRRAPSSCGARCRSTRARALPVVCDLEPQHRRLDGDANVAGLRMSVPLDVRQRFLCDPVGGHLDGGGERGQRARSVDRDGGLRARTPATPARGARRRARAGRASPGAGRR